MRITESGQLGLRLFKSWFVALCLTASAGVSARASQAYGSINNFDVVNDTGVECHGFEIEIEDIQSTDITYTFDWNHYGTPKIIEDTTNPQHPKVIVRYSSAKTNEVWAAYTAVPAGPIAPTDGHMFTDPSLNFGGEHFGVGYGVIATNITYYWLVDNGAGTLIRGPAVTIATPSFTFIPPAGGAPAQVQAIIQPAPAPPVLEFGSPSWVKEIRTTSHNNNEVKLRDLVADDPDDPSDKNWRNGEPDEVEVEWQLFQTEFNKPNGGANGALAGAPEDLPGGDEIVTRRYEFYKYTGPLDDETGEALADRVGPDGTHGVGMKIVNGTEVDLSTIVVVGDYVGAQMSAFGVDAPVGLIEHVQDGILNEPYPSRTVVVAGTAPFTATNSGVVPPGLTFDPIAGQLAGVPTQTGVFSFTIEATAGNDPVVRRTYTLTVTEPGEVLPPRSTVDTVASPLDGGHTSGDGTYVNGTSSTVSATPSADFVFLTWTEHGKVVSATAEYTFTNVVNRSLVANFILAGPTISGSLSGPGILSLTWSTNAVGFFLQRNGDLGTTNWLNVTNVITVVGDKNQVTFSPLTENAFFRLYHP